MAPKKKTVYQKTEAETNQNKPPKPKAVDQNTEAAPAQSKTSKRPNPSFSEGQVHDEPPRRSTRLKSRGACSSDTVSDSRTSRSQTMNSKPIENTQKVFSRKRVKVGKRAEELSLKQLKWADRADILSSEPSAQLLDIQVDGAERAETPSLQAPTLGVGQSVEGQERAELESVKKPDNQADGLERAEEQAEVESVKESTAQKHDSQVDGEERVASTDKKVDGEERAETPSLQAPTLGGGQSVEGQERAELESVKESTAQKPDNQADGLERAEEQAEVESVKESNAQKHDSQVDGEERVASTDKKVEGKLLEDDRMVEEQLVDGEERVEGKLLEDDRMVEEQLVDGEAEKTFWDDENATQKSDGNEHHLLVNVDNETSESRPDVSPKSPSKLVTVEKKRKKSLKESTAQKPASQVDGEEQEEGDRMVEEQLVDGEERAKETSLEGEKATQNLDVNEPQVIVHVNVQTPESRPDVSTKSLSKLVTKGKKRKKGIFFNYYHIKSKQMNSNQKLVKKEAAKMWRALPVEEKQQHAVELASSENSAESNESEENFICRCSPSRFIKLVSGFTDEQKAACNSIGFGNLLNMAGSKLYKTTLRQLIDCIDVKECTIKIHGETLELAADDFAWVMGLRNDGLEVSFKGSVKDYPELMDLVQEFSPKEKKQMLELREVEKYLAKKESPADDKFKRLFVLYTLSTILTPSASLYISQKWLLPLRDTSSIKTYNWAQFAFVKLIKGISEFRIRQQKSQQNSPYISGCILFLQLFYFSAVDLPRSNSRPKIPIQAWADKEARLVIKTLKKKGGLSSDSITLRNDQNHGCARGEASNQELTDRIARLEADNKLWKAQQVMEYKLLKDHMMEYKVETWKKLDLIMNALGLGENVNSGRGAVGVAENHQSLSNGSLNRSRPDQSLSNGSLNRSRPDGDVQNKEVKKRKR